MKKSLLYIAASLASIPFVTGAFAGPPINLDETRCGNAGIGNGAEELASGSGTDCMKRVTDRFETDDVDPGKSAAHNANNYKSKRKSR